MDAGNWMEKRRFPRVEARRQAKYRIIHGRDPDKVTSVQRGLVLNISGGGLLLGVQELEHEGLHISLNEEINEQNWLAIEIDLLPGRPAVRAMGKVAWYQRAANSTDYKYDVGIEFKDIPGQHLKIIMDFVSQSAGD